MGLIRWIATRVAVSVVSRWLRDDDAAIAACVAYSKDEPFERVIEAYVKTTPIIDDDDILLTLAEVERRLRKEPLRRLTEEMLPSDEIREFIERVVERVVEGE